MYPIGFHVVGIRRHICLMSIYLHIVQLYVPDVLCAGYNA